MKLKTVIRDKSTDERDVMLKLITFIRDKSTDGRYNFEAQDLYQEYKN